MRNIAAFSAVLLLLLAAPLTAVPGDDSGLFVTLPQGARPTAMGEAFTAVSGDVFSAQWNPAGIADLGSWAFAASFTPTYLDMYYGCLAGARSWRRTAVSLSLCHFDYGDLEGLDEHARNPAIFSASDLAVNLGFAYRIQRQKLQLGASACYLREEIEQESAGSVMFGLGAIKRLGRFSAGLAARNIGPGLKLNSESCGVPTTISAGITYYFLELPLVPALSVDVPLDDAPVVSAGFEYTPLRPLSLRAGLRTERDDGFLSWLRAGFGVRYQSLRLDYAVIPSQDMGYTHTVSLGLVK